MRSLRNRGQPASTAAAAQETTSNMLGLGEELPDEDFYGPADSFNPSEDCLPVTNVSRYQEYLQQFHASQLKPLASPIHSPSSMKGTGGSGSEAASNRKSPDSFTSSPVMGSTYTDDRSIPTNATPSVENSPIGSPESIIFSTPIHGQQFISPAHHTPTPFPDIAQRPLASARDRQLQGLGIHTVSYRTPYEPAYEPGASFMTYTQNNTAYSLSEQAFAGRDHFHVMNTQVAQMTETELDRAATHPEDIYDLLSNHSATEELSTSFMTYPDPEQATQNTVNAPSTPDLSASDSKNYTPGSMNTPRTINTPAYSLDGEGSPRSTTAFPHTKSNMSKSVTSLSTAFKKPVQPLTAQQMVDEATHKPTMDLVEVALQHQLSKDQHLVVESMDYRDSSWQGRSDEHKGWTPYLDFADFPDVLEMLRNMRSDPSECMPDNATIFKSLQEVTEWRENERRKSCRNQNPQDQEELPRTDEEKAAIVKLLFKAFKSTVDGQSNETVMTHFNAQIHSNAHVEAICWQLLEAAIQRSEGGPLCQAYEPKKPAKSAGNRDLNFAQRINALIQALMWEKSVCVNLLRAPKVLDAVDYPSYLGKRTGGNRELNKKKAEIAKLGKMKLQELQNENVQEFSQKTEAPSRPPTRRGKRTKEQSDDYDSDSDSTKASPPKRRYPERSPFATPARRFATVNTSNNGHSSPQQVAPSSIVIASNNSSSTPSYFPSPAPSITNGIRGQMSNYSLDGLSHQHITPLIPQSPFRQLASLDTVNLPPHRYTAGFEHQYPYVGANDSTDGGY